MIIALDIDGTIIESGSLVYKILNSCPKKFLGLNKNSSKLFDTSKTYKKTALNKVLNFLNPNKFHSIDSAIDVINHFAQKHVVVLLSSRPSHLKCIQYLTEQNIKQFNISSDLVFLGVKNKEEFCKENNVDVLIDNNMLTCVAVSNNSKTKVICFSPSQNKDKEGIMVANTWIQLFLEIGEIAKQKPEVTDKQSVIDSILNQFDGAYQRERQ